MAVRLLALPADLARVGRIVTDSFQYPGHPEWSLDEVQRAQVADSVRNLRRFWPLFGAARRVLPGFRDLLHGAIWDEDGEAAGVVLFQRLGTSATWHVGTVGVLPEYRRRGIARHLVECAISEMRDRDAARVTLDVIAGNQPALVPYESLGFARFSGTVDLSYDGGELAAGALPRGLRLEPLGANDWEPRVRLLERVTPAEVRGFEPVDAAEYRMSPGARLLVRPFLAATGVRLHSFALHDADVVAGWARVRAHRRGGVHLLTLAADPAAADAARWLVAEATRRALAGGPGRRVDLTVDAWQPGLVAEAVALGYAERVRQHRLGLTLG